MTQMRGVSSWVQPHEILLETELEVIVGGREGHYGVILTKERLILRARPESGCLSQARAQLSIMSHNIVSVRPPHQEIRKKGNKRKKEKQPVFTVVAYPAGENGGEQRKKQMFHFQLPKTAQREEVDNTTRVWIETITEVCMRKANDVSREIKSPLLILINPKSGKGGGLAVWEQVFPVLQEAGVLWEVILTEGPGHASQMMSSLDLMQWSGVVIVSGDGLVHEVYNGLLSRTDWRTALEFNVGVIPAGSGNALSYSLMHWQGEKFEPDSGVLSAAVNVARFNTIPLDLFMLKSPGMEARVGFLSLGWGLIADVDLDSEPLRWMGSLRFTIYALLRMARRRVYRGTISYIPADWPDQRTNNVQVPIHPLDNEESSCSNNSLDDQHSTSNPVTPLWLSSQSVQHKISQQPPLLSGCSQSWQELSERLSEVNLIDIERKIKSEDPILIRMSSHSYHKEQDFQNSNIIRDVHKNKTKREYNANYINRTSFENNTNSNFNKNNNKDFYSNNLKRYIQNNNLNISHSDNGNINSTNRIVGSYRTSEGANDRQKQHAVTRSSLTSTTVTGIQPSAPSLVYPLGSEPTPPQLDTVTATPLDQDWVTETSDYLTVYLLNLPYLDKTMFVAPDSRPDDGVLWLVIIRQSASRLDLLKFMLSVETGDHVDIPGVDLFPVTAAKVEPDPTNPVSFMTIDGEKIPSSPVEVHVLPKAGRVMVK